MKYSVIKDAILPKLGMGVAGVPQNENGEADFLLAVQVMDECMERGINYFDVGYNYLHGKCENFFKEAITDRYPRESFYLADKMPIWDASSPKRVEEIYEEEKKRCGVSYFDFYYIQQIEEINYYMAENSKAFDFIIKKKKQGEINYIGASFHCGPKLFREVLEKYGDELDFVQLQLNFMDWYGKDAKSLHKIACEFNKPIIVMSPLRGGFLTNCYSKKICDMLSEAGEETGKDYAQLGFGFVDSLQNVACVLSGMNSVEMVRKNYQFFSSKGLTETELEKVHETGKAMLKEAFINCSFCNYCSECPSKIRIPQILDLHNRYVTNAKNNVWEIYPLIIDAGYMPQPCIGCKQCEKLCPQQLPVTQIIAKCSTGLYGTS